MGAPEDAQSMVMDCDHSGWQNGDIAKAIGRYLGSANGLSFKITLGIRQKLSFISQIAQRLKEDKETSKVCILPNNRKLLTLKS